MNVVEFRVERRRRGDLACLNLYVDGRDLGGLATQAELPYATAAGYPRLAEGYEGLSAESVRWPSRHFLGAPVRDWFEDGDTAMVDACEACGLCAPLTAVVAVEAATVTWRRFRKAHYEDWTLDALGPYMFDRTQYEALRATLS